VQPDKARILETRPPGPHSAVMSGPSSGHILQPNPSGPRLTQRVSGAHCTGGRVEAATAGRAPAIFLSGWEIVTADTIGGYPVSRVWASPPGYRTPAQALRRARRRGPSPTGTPIVSGRGRHEAPAQGRHAS